MSNWYVIHTKPRQEARALENLQAQGYHCYLPLIAVEKIRQHHLSIEQEPLFARYLFIELDSDASGKSWSPIRSTLGVSKLVSFGTEPLKASRELIEALRQRTETVAQTPIALHQPGDAVRITDGPFAGLEGVLQMTNGESRAMVLLELLSKPTQVTLPIASLTKAR